MVPRKVWLREAPERDTGMEKGGAMKMKLFYEDIESSRINTNDEYEGGED